MKQKNKIKITDRYWTQLYQGPPPVGVLKMEGASEEHVKYFMDLWIRSRKKGDLIIMGDKCKLYNFENGKWVKM
jgi:hypothetical protein